MLVKIFGSIQYRLRNVSKKLFEVNKKCNNLSLHAQKPKKKKKSLIISRH